MYSQREKKKTTSRPIRTDLDGHKSQFSTTCRGGFPANFKRGSQPKRRLSSWQAGKQGAGYNLLNAKGGWFLKWSQVASARRSNKIVKSHKICCISTPSPIASGTRYSGVWGSDVAPWSLSVHCNNYWKVWPVWIQTLENLIYTSKRESL